MLACIASACGDDFAFIAFIGEFVEVQWFFSANISFLPRLACETFLAWTIAATAANPQGTLRLCLAVARTAGCLFFLRIF